MSVSSARNSKALLELLKIPENRVCYDCGTKEPRWCSLSFGVFICIRCAGLHRKYFGKVKSIDLDNWEDPNQVQVMAAMGNYNALEVYKSTSTIPPENAQQKFIEAWLEEKYRPSKPEELYPQKPAPVFTTPVQPLGKPRSASTSRAISPTFVNGSGGGVTPTTSGTFRPTPSPSVSSSVPLVQVPAPEPAPVPAPVELLEPRGRTASKTEILALYSKPTPQNLTKETILVPEVINVKPLKSTPNYDISFAPPQQQYYAPVYNVTEQPYPYQPAPTVLVVQAPSVYAPPFPAQTYAYQPPYQPTLYPAQPTQPIQPITAQPRRGSKPTQNPNDSSLL